MMSAESEAFRDLAVRFFLNLPKEELDSFERLFYQIEQAHWFYEDFLRVNNPQLPKYSLRDFCRRCFEECEILKPFLSEFETYFQSFRDYLHTVPVCGAILLNQSMNKVLLVRGWKGKSWGFPKGKINQGESVVNCAIREVLEETGYDISSLLVEKDLLQGHEKEMLLFIIRGVPTDTVFKTQTRKEISEIKWFDIESVIGETAKKFWGVRPFIKGLRRWIAQHKKGKKSKGGKRIPIKEKLTVLKDDKYALGTGTWSAEEMFAANEKLGVHSTEYSSLDELTSSLADAGSRYRSFQGGAVLHSDSLSNFSFDAAAIMNTLSSALRAAMAS